MSDRVTAPDAPRLSPPRDERPGETGRAGLSSPGIWAGALILLALALVVTLLLPPLVGPPEPAGDRPGRPPETTADDDGPDPAILARRDAEDRMKGLLRRRAGLEAADVRLWGGQEYASLLRQIALGDDALSRGRYREAGDRYREAEQGFDRLEQSRAERFTEALAAGGHALERMDVESAESQFRIAAALRPDHPEVREALARTAALGQVLELTREGVLEEERSAWDAARDRYARALAIDPGHRAAREGLERVTAVLRESGFSRAMSRLLEALEGSDFGTAAEAVKQARELKPEAPELADAERRLAVARRNDRLGRLEAGARQAEATEQWARAVELYGQALQVDPAAGFARDGSRRAQRRLEMDQMLEHYLQQPERLQAEQPRANARTLLRRLEGVRDAGPRLAGGRERLAALLQAAEARVPVRIRSDGATEIQIYRVGRFSPFPEREFELRPGTYTLVGSRKGYRDVRRTLQVRPGEPVDILFRCEERI